MLYYILVVTFYNVATRWNLRYLSTCYLFGTAVITVWLFFIVVLMIQISQQPLKLTVLPPLNYKHNHLSISCISKSNFFVMILCLQKCLNWQNCYAAFMLCKLDEILS